MNVTSLLSLILGLIQFLSPIPAQSDQKVELVVQTSHLSFVRSISFSPDGQILASAGDGSVILWEVKSGRQIRTFQGEAPVAFGPDGNILAGVSDEKNIKLWNIITGKEIRTLEGHTSDIESLAFNYDGTMLASGGSGNAIKSEGPIPADISSDTTIKLWKVRSGKLIHTLTGHSSLIRCLAFSADGKILASGSGSARKDDSKKGSTEAKSSFYDTTVKLWDVDKGVETHTLSGHVRPLCSLRINADGKTLVSADNGYAIKLWDIESGVESRSFSWPKDKAFGGVLSPDGNIFASSTIEGEVEWINVNTGKVIHRITGIYARFKATNVNIGKVDQSNPSVVLALAFSPDGKKLAGADMTASIMLWDVETGRGFLAARKRVFLVSSVRFSPDGKNLASVSRLNTVNLWNVGDVTEPKILKTFEVPIGTFGVVFSPNGKTLASTDWFTPYIELWDVKSGAKLKTFKAHSKEISSLSFSADGKKLGCVDISSQPYEGTDKTQEAQIVL